MNYKIQCIFLFSFLIGFSTLAQEGKITGNVLEGGKKDGERYQKWIGNVVYNQKNTTIYCDSAYYFDKKNLVEAYGNIRIVDGDSIRITGKKLIYDGKEKLAQMREDVVFTDGRVTVTTDNLNHDMKNNRAYYFGGGKLVDENSVLTSESGAYDLNSKVMTYEENVLLKDPEYTLSSDFLQYNTIFKVAYFKGNAKITGKDGEVLEAEEGRYSTISKDAFFQLSEIETLSYIISGDKLGGDETEKFYTADGNVKMVSKDENATIYGDYARSWKKDGITKVFGNALMVKPFDGDTLYLAADTLVAIEDSLKEKNRILAFPNVRIYKSDLQGKADSMAYHTLDSTIFIYEDPILWNKNNQLTADSIDIEITKKAIHKMNMRSNAFVVSEDTIKNFNQVTGKNMIAHFLQGNIDKVDVLGNGESLYYVLEGDTITSGINKIICSNMLIEFFESKVNYLNFYTNVDASFIPPHEFPGPSSYLTGFVWRAKERPNKKEVVAHNTSDTPKNERLEIYK